MDKHDPDTERAIRAFVPTRIELIALPSASLLFLTLSNSFEVLRSVEGKHYQLIISFMEAQVKSVLASVDRLIGPNAPLVLFWMLVGIIVYILLWVVIGAYTTYKNDLPREKGMIVPRDYNRSKVLRASVAHLLTRVIAAVLLITWAYLLFAEVLPFASELFLQGIEKIRPATAGYSLLSTLILTIWLFSISVLARCVLLRDRVFGG